MRPIDLIREDLGEEMWSDCELRLSSDGELLPSDQLSPFESSKTYVIHGKTGQFEFTTLPHGSYCLYLVNGRRAIRLTRDGREIEQVLEDAWQSLIDCDPVVLATLVLKFFDGGIHESHQVLRNSDCLISCEGIPKLFAKDYVFDESELAKSQKLIRATSVTPCGDTLVVRAVALRGWMHDKRNLGIERIHISKSGKVSLEERQVLSERIFEAVPPIMY